MACWPPKEGNFREMQPSPKKCISPGGTHQASPLACSIGPGGQNLAGACPQVFLASFCSWLPVLTLFSHLGLGVGCFLDFGVFLLFWGSWHATTVPPWPVGLGAPKSMGHGLPVAPKWAHKAQPAVAWRGCQFAKMPISSIWTVGILTDEKRQLIASCGLK